MDYVKVRISPNVLKHVAVLMMCGREAGSNMRRIPMGTVEPLMAAEITFVYFAGEPKTFCMMKMALESISYLIFDCILAHCIHTNLWQRTHRTRTNGAGSGTLSARRRSSRRLRPVHTSLTHPVTVPVVIPVVLNVRASVLLSVALVCN